VERLIESFALLAGRVHHKLDDEFPEITEAVLDNLYPHYPHYLRPVPPLGIVQFQLHPSQSGVAGAVQIPAGTALHSRPFEGTVCSFRTSYPTALWPIRITDAGLISPGRVPGANLPQEAAAVIRIAFECLGGLKLSQLPIESLRLYLKGSTVVHSLYETLFLDALRVQVRSLPAAEGAANVILPATSLRPVGFDMEEGVLPYTDRSFLGYRLLQEYFIFPEKFFFIDVAGLGAISKQGFGSRFELLIPVRQRGGRERLIALEQNVDESTFQLGCAPMINLFERIADPVRLTHTKTEYRVIADVHRQMSTEIYSIDRVTSTVSYQQEPRIYEPFYALRHGSQADGQRQLWFAKRRESFRNEGDTGTEVYLCLVDLDFNPSVPAVEMLTVGVTCTNRDLATRIPLDKEFGELQPEGVALAQARCIRKPTPTIRPPLRRSLQWRLISHLTLNYLSIVEGGKLALQEILRLYDFQEDPAIRKQIAGITDVGSRAAVSRVASKTGVTFCRGTETTIGFDEDEFVGTGVFLLASVLERFLALYSSVNSFSTLKAITKKGVLKQWPPRAGEQILL
jgi:type VI secretion system protein ImpG